MKATGSLGSWSLHSNHLDEGDVEMFQDFLIVIEYLIQWIFKRSTSMFEFIILANANYLNDGHKHGLNLTYKRLPVSWFFHILFLAPPCWSAECSDDWMQSVLNPFDLVTVLIKTKCPYAYVYVFV